MSAPSRRGVLRAVGAALPVALAGCNAASDDTETTTRSTTSGTTPPATTNASLPSVSLTRYQYSVRSRRVRPDTVPVGDAVAAAALSDAARNAIATAVEGQRFETADPSPRLLRDVEDLDLVEYDGSYYDVSHTFTEYAVDLVEDADPGSGATIADWESLEPDSVVRDAVSLPLPRGPERPMRPYRTLYLPPELAAFLDEYTHLRYSGRVYRIERTVERHDPPYTLTVEPAGETDLYGQRLVDLGELGARSRAFLRRVREPTGVPAAGWGDGVLYADDVPRPVEREFSAPGGAYAKLRGSPADSVLSVFVRDVDWDRPPLALAAEPVADPAGVELAVTNESQDFVRLTNQGVAPFGVLWAVPADGDPRQLWTPAYETADAVDVSGDTAEATGGVDRKLLGGKTLRETYRLARGDRSVPSGTYEARGVLAGEWNRPDGTDSQFVVYPFGVTVTVDDG